MKAILVILALALGFNAHASTKRLIAQGGCGTITNGTVTNVRFYGNSAGQVAADLDVEDSIPTSGDDSQLPDSVQLGVISKMHADGEQIVDEATGRVCAKMTKPVIGKRLYITTSHCNIAIVDHEHQSQDSFGRETGYSCTRDYFLVTK